MTEQQWQGVAVSALDDRTLRDAWHATTALLSALIMEIGRRGYWKKEWKRR